MTGFADGILEKLRAPSIAAWLKACAMLWLPYAKPTILISWFFQEAFSRMSCCWRI